MRGLLILMVGIFIFFGILGLTVNKSTRYNNADDSVKSKIIIEECRKTDDLYELEECRIYIKTLTKCRAETPGTDSWGMCIADLSMTQYNLENCFNLNK